MKNLMSTLLLAAFAVAALPASAAEIVVIVSQKNPATRMFSEQASQFFLGKSNLFTPVDQADGSAIRNEFYHKVADKDAAQVKALWSKLVFTGKATPPKEYASSAEVKKAVAADPKAIGYIDKSAVDDTVKVILTLP
ncbi:type 2 periplasmic-binding domain-containing protein [Duganella sp. PWIR1]|jgi:ABC-type phosphate transport system substrate-binding protein